jgi:predicted nucleic acid-binding protein
MRISITDANIFIDLIHIGLLESFFDLEFDFHTTNEVILELISDQQAMIMKIVEAKKLKIIKLTEEEHEIIENENFGTKKLSLADKTVFYVAKKINAIILSGDNLLRKVSIKKDFEVHGSLWILESLVSKQIINSKDAEQKLIQLMAYNPRLPKNECFKKLEEWRKL